MTNELKFSRESLSLMKIVSAPANIICAIISSYLSSEKPFRFFYQITLVCMSLSCYNVLVLLRNFPKDPIEQQSPHNIMHVTTIVLLTELAQNFWFTTSFVIIAFIIDKRIAGIHITLLASITNLSQFTHKFYIFSIVDKFGIFAP